MSYVVEREDGHFRYLDYRYAVARFDAPGSKWARIVRHVRDADGWPEEQVLLSRFSTRFQEGDLMLDHADRSLVFRPRAETPMCGKFRPWPST